MKKFKKVPEKHFQMLINIRKMLTAALAEQDALSVLFIRELLNGILSDAEFVALCNECR